MNFSYPQIVLQEVPDEISLALSISGCSIKCKGCHSSFTWNPKYGEILTQKKLQEMIDKYSPYLSCVLFYGGEWDKDLTKMLKLVKKNGLKTALFSGLELTSFLDSELIQYTDYLKVGPYIEELGGLDSTKTNQRFYSVKNHILTDLTFKFLN